MKKSNQKISVTIDVSSEAAWGVIGAVDGVDKWLAPIQACRLEGNKRYCTTEGGEFSEDILKVDHENRVLSYGIPVQHMIPVKNILGYMQVHDSANGQATVEWSWDFDVEEAREAEAKETLAMVGNIGITGIEALLKGSN
ncbi:MAG: SRPBCC family protein [Haliscomenobacteraceae bacterium CHB4]|nr:hypothetical protein [Saprospiraceae bacterium]MCE7922451.1 SRPBCC family protein [Haliscomenobacteraceae bacterium CHB4]